MDIPPPPSPSPEDAPPAGAPAADAAPTVSAIPSPPADASAPPGPPAPYNPFAAPAEGAPAGPAGPPPVPPAPAPHGAGLPPYPRPEQPYGQPLPGGPYAGPYGGPYSAPYSGGYGGGYGEQHPYGAPGPYGHPAPPPGWYPVERGTNGLAIASLTLSLGLLCLPLVAGLLGVLGLRQIRRSGQRGRGLAIAGIVINSVATVLVALVVTLAVIGSFGVGNTSVQDIKVGQCFNTVGSSLSDYGGGGGRSTTVDVVSCDAAHDAEAYAVFTLDPSLGSAYPGLDRITQVSNDQCGTYAGDYLGDAKLAAGLEIYFYLPPRTGWDRGERAVTCFFGSRAGKVTGSVKSGGGQAANTGVGV